jgi:hypothetical protein
MEWVAKRAFARNTSADLNACAVMAEARTNPRGDFLKEKLIPNQSVSTLMGRSRAGQNFMSLIPKTKQLRRVGHD